MKYGCTNGTHIHLQLCMQIIALLALALSPNTHIKVVLPAASKIPGTFISP